MPNEDSSIIEPEDTNTPTVAKSDLPADAAPIDAAAPADPNDEVPVPVVMEPAEIDERAQVVEALRGREQAVRDDDSEMRA